MRLFAGTSESLLEKIRFSITRLKSYRHRVVRLQRDPWKDKILDYEIEIEIPF